MTENMLETIRKGVQDFVAPEVRQIKADFGALGAKFDGLRAEVDALRSEVRANQLALMAALENAVLRGEIGNRVSLSVPRNPFPPSAITEDHQPPTTLPLHTIPVHSRGGFLRIAVSEAPKTTI